MMYKVSDLKVHLYEILDNLSHSNKEVIIVNTHKKTKYKLTLIEVEVPEFGMYKAKMKGKIDFTEPMDEELSIPNYKKKKIK
jgi:hypothetical protein